MKPIPSLAFAKAMVLLYVFAPVLAQDHVYKPLTDKGCYSSSDPLKDQGPWDFQSSGYCQETCADAGYPVMGTKGANCWCGDLLPASSSKVPDSKCDTACQGFPDNICR